MDPEPRGKKRDNIGNRVLNEHQSIHYKVDDDFNHRIRTWKVRRAVANVESEPLATGNEVKGQTHYRCITYHAKGFYFDNCDRKHDHIQLGREETAKFHEWCVKAYA